jgi:hypothetical protein
MAETKANLLTWEGPFDAEQFDAQAVGMQQVVPDCREEDRL